MTAKSTGPFRRLWSLRLVHLSFATWFVLGMQTVFMIMCFWNGADARIQKMPLAQKALFVAVNYVGTIIYFQIIGLLLRRWPIALRIVNLLSIWMLAFMFCWHYYSGRPIDYMMVAGNIGELFHWESVCTLAACSSIAVLIGLLLLAAGLCILAFRTGLLARWPSPTYTRGTLLGSVAVLTAISASPAAFHHDLTYFGRMALTYFISPVECPNDYIYVRHASTQPDQDDNFEPPPRPNVFLIMVESFNGHFVDSRNAAGKEFTPFFNSLRSRGLWVDHFYGNSIQTPLGQEAVLAGIPPSYRMKIAHMRRMPRLKALPKVLREAGYQTFYYQGHKSLTFDNTAQFMRHLGFESVMSVASPDQLTPQDANCMWNYWGIQDDRLYKKAFAHLDKSLRRSPDRDVITPAPPIFVTFATITSHMKWTDLPPGDKLLYPEAGNGDTFKNFANAIRLTDKYLETFFAELQRRPWFKDSIVIIVGDHGYPRGEHDNNFTNQAGYFDENFRTPFVLIWPGRIKPRAISDRAHSQIDIAPTLLELLRLNVDHHFVGQSMLSPAPVQHAIPLVQPYDGPSLIAMIYPLKYIVNRATGQELLYNLADDPGEEHNLISQYANGAILKELREQVYRLEVNQVMIEKDRIWPGY